MWERVAQPEIATGIQPALKGVKVLDLAQFEEGPSCAEALAWLGADVVEVDGAPSRRPGRRDRRSPTSIRTISSSTISTSAA